jgi:hypothetical protein
MDFDRTLIGVQLLEEDLGDLETPGPCSLVFGTKKLVSLFDKLPTQSQIAVDKSDMASKRSCLKSSAQSCRATPNDKNLCLPQSFHLPLY